MAGLESIALAVDFLEREKSESVASNPSAMVLAPNPTATAAPPMPTPSRSGFLNAPRRVSSDSVYDDSSPNSATLSPPPPPQDLAVAESLTPEAITRMVENLSDDGEFKNPPPPPPEPTEAITLVKEMDVLCGRGGETNHHAGNVKYRTLVKRYQPLYIMSKRRDKPLIASKIVRLVRHMGGRFLRKDKSNTWRDVGNTKAREKTSQALREGAPDLRSPQKEKTDSKQADASPTSPSTSTTNLGVRNQSEMMAGSGMALLAQMAGGSSAMETTNQGEADAPSTKKMRLDGPAPPLPVHGLPQFWGGAPPQAQSLLPVPVQGLTTMGMGSVVPPSESTFGRPTPPRGSFVATISADDDDTSGSGSDDQQRPKPRGPRKKLLMRRLQEEEGSK